MSAWKCAAGQIRLASIEAMVARVVGVEDIRSSVVAKGQRIVGLITVCECVVVAAAGGQAFHRHPDTLTLSQPHPHTLSLLIYTPFLLILFLPVCNSFLISSMQDVCLTINDISGRQDVFLCSWMLEHKNSLDLLKSYRWTMTGIVLLAVKLEQQRILLGLKVFFEHFKTLVTNTVSGELPPYKF